MITAEYGKNERTHAHLVRLEETLHEVQRGLLDTLTLKARHRHRLRRFGHGIHGKGKRPRNAPRFVL